MFYSNFTFKVIILLFFAYSTSLQSVFCQSTFYGYYDVHKEVIIKDTEYYKYLNEVAQHNYEVKYQNDKATIERAVNYLKDDDHESAYYYAKKVNNSHTEWIFDLKHWILCVSAAKEFALKGENNYFLDSRLEEAKRRVDPETYREIESDVFTYFPEEKLEKYILEKKKKNNRGFALVITTVALVGLGGIIALMVWW